MTRALTLATAITVLFGCAGSEPLRVGAKSFAEQRILAHLVAGLATARAGVASRVVECGDTYGCQRDLRSGAIDVLVEYSGTALALSGADPETSTGELYEALDLAAVARLGFDNGYALVVPAAAAERGGLRTISDLAARGEPITVAAPSTYLGRPRDGLPSLLRRYGLRMSGAPQVLDDATARYAALSQGRADVAIGYETDPALDEPSLVQLEDDLGFFPPYEAEVVARRDALARVDGLEEELGRLDGRIDAPAMREMLAQVQREGREPREVARRFLSQRDLAEVSTEPSGGVELAIAVHAADTLPDAQRRAIRAARRAFPDRRTPTRATRDVASQLATGRARLAILGAERFFVVDGASLPQRDERLSALAVLSTRVVHVLRRGDGDRVGAPPPGSGASLLAEAIFDGSPAARGEPAELIARLTRGELDAAIVIGPSPHPEVARALREHPDLTLAASTDAAHPALRPVLIPAGTYPGQAAPVATVAAQVLLAGASLRTEAHAVVGPAAALRVGGAPITEAEREALHDALGGAELPDPSLPSPWSIDAAPPADDDADGPVFDTAVNVFVLAFLAWLAWLMLRPLERRRPA